MAQGINKKLIWIGALAAGIFLAYFLGFTALHCIEDHKTECVHPAEWWYYLNESDRANWANSLAGIFVVVATLIAIIVALRTPFVEAEIRRSEAEERRARREKGLLFWLYQELWSTRARLSENEFLRGESHLALMTIGDLLTQVKGLALETDSSVYSILKDAEYFDVETFRLISRAMRSIATYRLVHAEIINGLSSLNPHDAASSIDHEFYVKMYTDLREYGLGRNNADAVIPNIQKLLARLRWKYPVEIASLLV